MGEPIRKWPMLPLPLRALRFVILGLIVAAGLVLTRQWDVSLLEYLFWCWVIGVAGTAVYFIADRREPFFHIGQWVTFGLTGGAAACFVAWVVLGGWGPPAPEFFGCLGLGAGLLIALMTWNADGSGRAG